MVIFEEKVEGATERSIARYLADARRAMGLRGKVNVMVTSNRSMRALNRRFRAKNKATDVLSFPAAGLPPFDLAGDIAISAPIATQNARKLGHTPAAELKILVLHGLLHLAGYDHEVDNGRMARRERQLRRALRLPDGLIERGLVQAPKVLKGTRHQTQKATSVTAADTGPVARRKPGLTKRAGSRAKAERKRS